MCMYEIENGQTRRQVTEMVKKSWIKMTDQILFKTDQERIGGIPFSPGISLHGEALNSALDSYRASACQRSGMYNLSSFSFVTA